MLTKRPSMFLKGLRIHLRRNYNKNVPFEDIPEVSALSIKRALKAHNINYEDGYACLITPCLSTFHAPKNEKGVKKVYVNKTTGMFLCSSCKKIGQWSEFESFLNSKDKSRPKMCPKAETEVDSTLEKIRDETIDLNSLNDDLFDGVLKKFSLPLITKSTLTVLDLRIDKSNETLYFPLENADSRIVGYLSLNKNGESKTIFSGPYCDGVLLAKQPKAKNGAVLVANIVDFFILVNSKISTNVLYLPECNMQLPQHLLPTLERFNKITIWFGNDFNSLESARLFAKKLGENRCFFVRPTDRHQLPHLLPEQDFRAVLNAAQPITHKSITTFGTLRQDVLSDLQNIDKVQGVKWKRFPALNKILKGHRRGELTVVTGPTGSGKTTFISEYSLDLAMQGINTLWGSFEIRNARLARIMLQQMVGVPLEENLGNFNKWADKFEKIPMYFMTFHGQQSIKIVMEAVEHATYVYDIAHVVIDNVQFMMGITDEHRHMDRFWKQDTIIAAFRTFATRKNCHVTLVIHPRKERDDEDLTINSIFGSAKATQEADNVLIIQDKRLVSLKGKKYLHIAKNRYSGDLGVMTLDFDKKSLSFVQKKKKTDKVQVETENEKENV